MFDAKIRASDKDLPVSEDIVRRPQNLNKKSPICFDIYWVISKQIFVANQKTWTSKVYEKLFKRFASTLGHFTFDLFLSNIALVELWVKCNGIWIKNDYF